MKPAVEQKLRRVFSCALMANWSHDIDEKGWQSFADGITAAGLVEVRNGSTMSIVESIH